MSGHSSGPRGVWCQLLQQLLLGLLAAASLINTCHADSSSVATDYTGINCATLLSASTSAEPASASTTSATESTASGSHSEPYDLDSIPNLASLLHTHQAYQISTLMNSRESHPVAVKAVLVNSNDLVGLGNRVPAAVTGFVLALLTKRLFFLHSTFQSYVELPFPGDWTKIRPRISGTNCKIPWKRFAEPSLDLCDDAYFEAKGHRNADIWAFSSIDYDVPLLQINPSLVKYFTKFFPDGEVFSSLIRHLLHPTPLLETAMQPYLQDAQQCAVGMHIRTRKYGGVRVKQFTSITRMVAQGTPGTVFVASDASLFEHVQRGLAGRKVWWLEYTADALQAATRTKAANPGSELSALLDAMLLSKCKHIVLTPASSLGSVAAGYAGVQPVFANFGKHADPFLNPWFWKSTTSEPCFCKASTMHVDTDELSTKFRDQHPMYLYYNQCHYQQRLRAIPPYLKLATNDTSYIQTLLN